PEIGSIVARHLERSQRHDIPVFVGDTQFYGGGPAYLGKAYAPFMVNPNNPISASGNNTYDEIPVYPPQNGQGVQHAADSTLRLQQRADLLHQIDSFRRQADRSGSLDAWDRHQRLAVAILASRR